MKPSGDGESGPLSGRYVVRHTLPADAQPRDDAEWVGEGDRRAPTATSLLASRATLLARRAGESAAAAPIDASAAGPARTSNAPNSSSEPF